MELAITALSPPHFHRVVAPAAAEGIAVPGSICGLIAVPAGGSRRVHLGVRVTIVWRGLVIYQLAPSLSLNQVTPGLLVCFVTDIHLKYLHLIR